MNKKFAKYLLSFIAAILSFIFFYTLSHPPQSQNEIIKTQPVYDLSPAVSQSNLSQIQLSPTVTGYQQTKSDNDLYKVISVVDGDTFHAEIDGKKETIRLIGIDSPETVDPRKLVQCFGKEASSKAKELLTGHKVKLENDPTQTNRDKYNRLLRYVWSDEDLFINEWMIRNGYAHEYTYVIPYQYQVQFQEAEKYARENNLGLWNPEMCNNQS